MPLLTNRPIWHELVACGSETDIYSLREMFAKDPKRGEHFRLRCGSLLLDYSRERVITSALTRLVKLADEANLSGARKALFEGGIVNPSEKRPALHTALRRGEGLPINVQGKDVMAPILAERERALKLAEELRAGTIRGATGQPIRHLIHVGIGGSDLGPRLLTEALGDGKGPAIHFVANVDAAPLQRLLGELSQEETLVVLVSKGFTTAEVLRNGRTLQEWLRAKLGDKAGTHLLAVTAAVNDAQIFGVRDENIFRLWEWVGGRYSVWSAVSLSAMAAMGRKRFEEFLAGGAQVDQHFLTAPLAQNMPVLLALLGIWNINILGHRARAVLPYVEGLHLWPAYLQQLEMESLGKTIDKEGVRVEYATAPVVMGSAGTPAEHAFMQALHQGTQAIPAEIIMIAEDDQPAGHRNLLQAHALAQAEALAFGKSAEEIRISEKDPVLAAQKSCRGDKPCSLLIIDRLTPRALGELIALYEHKVFVQAQLWNINPFDQWGVELGKQLARPLEVALSGGDLFKQMPDLGKLRKN